MEVQSGTEFAAPGFCPECGAGLLAEVTEWDAETREPTKGGLLVYCETDSPNDPDAPGRDEHRNWQSDWIPVWADVLVWAQKNVRVR